MEDPDLGREKSMEDRRAWGRASALGLQHLSAVFGVSLKANEGLLPEAPEDSNFFVSLANDALGHVGVSTPTEQHRRPSASPRENSEGGKSRCDSKVADESEVEEVTESLKPSLAVSALQVLAERLLVKKKWRSQQEVAGTEQPGPPAKKPVHSPKIQASEEQPNGHADRQTFGEEVPAGVKASPAQGHSRRRRRVIYDEDTEGEDPDLGDGVPPAKGVEQEAPNGSEQGFGPLQASEVQPRGHADGHFLGEELPAEQKASYAQRHLRRRKKVTYEEDAGGEGPDGGDDAHVPPAKDVQKEALGDSVQGLGALQASEDQPGSHADRQTFGEEVPAEQKDSHVQRHLRRRKRVMYEEDAGGGGSDGGDDAHVPPTKGLEKQAPAATPHESRRRRSLGGTSEMGGQPHAGSLGAGFDTLHRTASGPPGAIPCTEGQGGAGEIAGKPTARAAAGGERWGELFPERCEANDESSRDAEVPPAPPGVRPPESSLPGVGLRGKVDDWCLHCGGGSAQGFLVHCLGNCGKQFHTFCPGLSMPGEDAIAQKCVDCLAKFERAVLAAKALAASGLRTRDSLEKSSAAHGMSTRDSHEAHPDNSPSAAQGQELAGSKMWLERRQHSGKAPAEGGPARNGAASYVEEEGEPHCGKEPTEGGPARNGAASHPEDGIEEPHSGNAAVGGGSGRGKAASCVEEEDEELRDGNAATEGGPARSGAASHEEDEIEESLSGDAAAGGEPAQGGAASHVEEENEERRSSEGQRNAGSGGIPFRKRKKKVAYSAEEDKMLEKGMELFGDESDKWKCILSFGRDVFRDRDAVSLKDRWRNMQKYKK